MSRSVASVPFLNAKPLVWAFERLGEESPVNVSFEQPSRLPSILNSGEAEAIFVSLIDALMTEGRTISGGCSLSSFGRVMSVRLFSKVPFDRVGTLALDSSSLTSNTLAQLVLRRMFGCTPSCTRETPDGQSMLSDNDACLLIGDKGLVFPSDGLYSLDLGEAWANLTGLPFVWACWVGREDLSPELAGHLLGARELGGQNLATIAGEAPDSIPPQLAHTYLTTVFDSSLDSRHMEALKTFGDWLVEDGLAPSVSIPRVVAPDEAARLSVFESLAATNA